MVNLFKMYSMVSEKKSELILKTILKMVFFLEFCIFGVFQNVQKDKGRRDKIRKILIRGENLEFSNAALTAAFVSCIACHDAWSSDSLTSRNIIFKC